MTGDQQSIQHSARPPATAPDLLLSSGRWELAATGGRLLRPVLAPRPVDEAHRIMDELRRVERGTGRAHLLYGLIPFDLREPACLRMTDAVVCRPRRWRAADGAPPRGASEPARASAPAAHQDPEYRRGVAVCLDHLGSGSLEKVVLSRCVDLPLPEGAVPSRVAEALLERLAIRDHLAADVYCARDSRGRYWLGASPEVVADVHDGSLMTLPLAGSLARRRVEDERRADHLLHASGKDLHEHELVVEHIGAALNGFVHDLDVPASPSLVATDTMWHLGTRITGRLPDGVSALEAALRIHPTPAVCGRPAAEAARLIGELEGRSRQFYAGLVGWTDSTGDGRWSLVLRGARIGEASVRVQAGAGIVPGSSPRAEHDETGAKLSTMLRQLRGLLPIAPGDAGDERATGA